MLKVLHWRMVAKNALANAVSKKESVTGVARKVGAVGKIGLEMDVMVLLEDLVSSILVPTMNAIFTQVCTVWTVKCFMSFQIISQIMSLVAHGFGRVEF